ncbi:MAG TPA: CHRD domain-containing protein [Flavisolibacter sp.]|nr:CHRD domain-containing protein [Flavisolibacter sp.]
MFVKKFYTDVFLLLIAITLFLPACDTDLGEDDGKQTTYSLSGNANGANERPNPVTTAATGTIAGTYDDNTNMLNYTITWTGLSGPPIAMHFHGPADRNTPAGVVIPIPLPSNPAAAGSVTGSATLTAQQETELLSELWYYNIHTDLNQGGEIRGQVVAR